MEQEQEIQEVLQEINIDERRNLIQEGQDNPISLDGEELFNLPQKRKVEASQLYYYNRRELESSQPNIYTQETKKLIEDIDRVLESHLFTWGEQNFWNFKLPHTVFQGNEPPIQFHKPQVRYGTHALSRLNAEQMNQIKLHGEFIVKGDTEDSQTTWRLNSFIIRGKDYIRHCLYRGLSSAFHQIIQIKCRLGWRYARNYHYGTQLFNPNLFNGIIQISTIATKILNLIFGIRKVQVFNKHQIIGEILKERSAETIKLNHPQIETQFFEFLFKQDNLNNTAQYQFNEQQKLEIKNQLADYQALINDFSEEVSKLEEQKIKQLEKEGQVEDEALMDIFLEKQKLLFSYIRSSKYIKDKQVQEHLINLITATQITKRYYYELEKEIASKREEKNREICTNHPIRSQVTIWRTDRVNNQLMPIIENLVKECNEKIIRELTQKNLPNYVVLFNRFVEFQQNQKQIYNQNYRRIQKKNTEPCRTFETFQWNFKPYKVKVNVDSEGKNYYSFDTGKSYKTPTSFFGWRLVLQLIRYKVWTKNVFVNLIDNLINSHFGLKALFKLSPFSNDFSVNYYTGEVKPTGKVNPYFVCFMEAMRGIKRTIQAFEAQPDRGIFGKNFARIFKYIECVFRFLVSVVFIGVGMPIAILINCILSFALAISSWLWIPVTLIIRWLFHILLWDLDSPTRKGWNYYTRSYSRYQTYQAFPLINGLINFTLGVFEVGASVASAAVLHPCTSILSSVITLCRYIGQNISDAIMCKITSKIGRQPEIDTFIAWKVRGAGVTRQYTYSMEVEDVKFLMRGHLERLELEEYQRRLQNRINEPSRLYSQLSNNIFSYYGISQNSNSYINSSIEKLMECLRKQINERQKKYPSLPQCNIKFTEEELTNVFFQCESLARTFIEQRKMEWIFPQFQVENNDYKILTERFLVDIFGDENILFPISELDKRIEIKTEKKNHFNSVQRALQGKTELKSFSATIKQKFKKFQKTFLFPFVDVSQVTSNSQDINNCNNFQYSKYSDPSKIAYNFNFKSYEQIMKEIQEQQKKNN